MTLDEFNDLLDQVPRTPVGILARDARGELRSLAIPALPRGVAETRRRFPRLERCRNRAALLGALIEKEERRIWEGAK